MDKEEAKMISIRNKLVKEYADEIRNLEMKIRGVKMTRTQVILDALQSKFCDLVLELKQNYKYTNEDIKKLINNKDLLKKHIIL